MTRDIAATPQYRQSRRDRKKVEILFAHLKRILKVDRLRQNLRRMAKRLFEDPKRMAAVAA